MRWRSQHGFTMIELTVVMLVIAVLTAVAVPAYLNQQDRGRDTDAKAKLRSGYAVAKSAAKDREDFFTTTSFNLTQLATSLSGDNLGPVSTANGLGGLNTNQLYVVSPDTSGRSLKLAYKTATGRLWTLDSLAGGRQAYRSIKTSPYANQVLLDNPIGYWRLGESSASKPLEDSRALRDGTYTGGVSSVPGAISNDGDTAMELNGTTGKAVVPFNSAFNLTSAYTVEFWMKLSSYGNSADWRSLLYKGANANDRTFGMWLNQGTTGRLHCSYGTGPGYVSGLTSTDLALNTWNHIVMTYAAGVGLKCYVNGALSFSANSASAAASGNTPIHIGSTDSGAPLTGTAGQFDEVAIYPTALSAAQIAAHWALRQ